MRACVYSISSSVTHVDVAVTIAGWPAAASKWPCCLLAGRATAGEKGGASRDSSLLTLDRRNLFSLAGRL